MLARLRQIRHSNAWIFGTMLFSACLSLTASFVLSVDAIALAKDPAMQQVITDRIVEQFEKNYGKLETEYTKKLADQKKAKP